MLFGRRSAWLLLALLANPVPAAGPSVWRTDSYGDPLPAGAVARLGTFRWRQLGSAWQLAYSADGRFLIGAGQGPTTVWDAATGQIVRCLDEPQGGQASPLTRVGLAVEGKILVSRVSQTGSALIWWDLDSGKQLAASEEGGYALDSVALPRKGTGAAAGGQGFLTERGSVLLLYDRPNREVAHRLLFPKENLLAVAFSADSKWVTGLFLTTEHHVIRRIDASSGRIAPTIAIRNAVRAVLARDGSCVAVHEEAGDLFIVNVPSGSRRKLSSSRGLAGHELLFADGNRVLLAFERSRPQVRRFDTRTGQELPPIRIGMELARHAIRPALSPDGKTLALAQGPNAVALVDVATGSQRNRLPGFTHSPTLLRFSADGRFITTLSEVDGLVRWDPSTGRPLLHTAASKADAVLRKTGVLSGSGERMIQAKWRMVEVSALPSGKRVQSRPVPEKAVGKTAVSADDTTLAMLGKDGVLRFWRLPDGKWLGEAVPDQRGRESLELVFSPDGRLLATVNGPHWVELWHVPSGLSAGRIFARFDHSLQKPGGWQGCFSKDAQRLYSAFGSLLQAWDIAQHQELPILMRERRVVNGTAAGRIGLSISADGRFLARVDGQGNMSLLETASGQVVFRLSGSCGAIAFAPRGWRLAAEDRLSLTVPIFDLPSLFLALPPLRQGGSFPDNLWADLAHGDAARAVQAAWVMRRIDGVEALLARKLVPVGPAVGERVSALIRALGSDEFSVRQNAEQELVGMRDSARKALETALQREKDIEVKYRLRRLLGLISGPSPSLLQEIRAVLVLEARDTPAARELLRRLAGGLAEARLTEEAAAALRRLESLSEKQSR
jgi:WD40 repeat protein